jgi:hypothetical protein
MAPFYAGFKFWYAHKGAVVTKGMAIKTSFLLRITLDGIIHFRVQMNQVAEIDRLHLLGIKGYGEKYPTNEKGG